MSLFPTIEAKYSMTLFEAKHPIPCPPGQRRVDGRCVEMKQGVLAKVGEALFEKFQLGEPFGDFKSFGDCKTQISKQLRAAHPDWKAETLRERTDATCGKLQRDLETKLTEMVNNKRLFESVDFRTWVIPTPGDNLIESEVLHVTVSGNRVDYTSEELLPAVNTLIGQPVWWVPLDQATMPDNLHKDPVKTQVGEVKLARFDNGTIHALLEVTPEIKQMVDDGFIPMGSIEANFAVDAASDKVIADRKPEFIQFTGYLLLPKEGTQTPAGPTGPPGDSQTRNQVFEQMRSQLGCCCLKGMMKEKPQKSIFY